MLGSLDTLAHRHRSLGANRRLGAFLAFVGGAINAGGFLVVHRYTSHMTGLVSSIGDELAMGHFGIVQLASGLVLAFFLGALTTSLLVNLARRHGSLAEYPPVLWLEAALLAGFIVAATRMPAALLHLDAVAALLCYMMGLQNALMTKISRSEIRTTHVTGLVTDIGIEAGRLLASGGRPAAANRERLATHCLVFAMFVAGGVAGAIAVNTWGVPALWPVVVALATMAALGARRGSLPASE